MMDDLIGGTGGINLGRLLRLLAERPKCYVVVGTQRMVDVRPVNLPAIGDAPLQSAAALKPKAKDDPPRKGCSPAVGKGGKAIRPPRLGKPRVARERRPGSERRCDVSSQLACMKKQLLSDTSSGSRGG